MCLDCGCGELNESHGDSRHITMDSIQSAAQASDISLEEAIRNIADGLSQAQASTEQTTSSSAASD
jgi:predicted NBD/HSP70 family sugar kinase